MIRSSKRRSILLAMVWILALVTILVQQGIILQLSKQEAGATEADMLFAPEERNTQMSQIAFQSQFPFCHVIMTTQEENYYRWKQQTRKEPVATTAVAAEGGFFFVKTHKTASSTAVGVHVRIAKTIASRLVKTTTMSALFPMCDNLRFQHIPATTMLQDYQTNHSQQQQYWWRQNKNQFLWTILREPTQRAVSDFFFFAVSRRHHDPHNDTAFINYLERGRGLNYYWKMLTVAPPQHMVMASLETKVQHILDSYHFIAITERLDESLVALQLLLGLSTADILYMSAKKNDNDNLYWDDGGVNHQCNLIQKSFVSPAMQSYFQTSKWKGMSLFDQKLYQAANRRLNHLIQQQFDPIVFSQQLKRFRQYQPLIEQFCQEEAIFPCPTNQNDDDHTQKNTKPALRFNQTNCLYMDSGCAWECLDRMSIQLGLWND